MNAKTQAQDKYFDSVLYARCHLNEIKIITPPKKGDKYCAINASIIDTFVDENGESKKSYKTIDLIVKGKPAKSLLWALRNRWPADRLKREDPRWIADINVGSIGSDAFRKKNGSIGAVLKGRLLNIRALKIGDELIHGEWDEQLPQPTLHAVCYINKLDLAKGRGKIAMLDGPVSDYSSKSVNINFNADDFPVFGEMEALKVIPKGYANRTQNAKVFSLMALTGLNPSGFKNDQGEKLSALWADLQSIRYLKADDHVLIGKTDNAA